MSTPKYLEFSSTYRDRNSYPLPSNFQISMTPQKGASNAIDPVSLAAPIFQWTSNAFNTGISTPNTPTATISGTIQNTPISEVTFNQTVVNTMDNFVLILNAGAGQTFQQLVNYYLSACISVTNTISGFTNTRRIHSFQYIGMNTLGDSCIIKVSPPFQDALLVESDPCTFTISDPSDFSDVNYPELFVPAGFYQPNAYIDYVLYNETINESRSITSYDVNTHLLLLNCLTNPIGTNWLTTHNYNLRKQLPILTSTTTASPFNTLTSIYIPNGSNVDNYYVNMWVRIVPTQTTPGAADNYYYIFSDIPPSPYYYSEIAKIDTYVGATKIATLTPLSYIPPTGSDFEIINFSYDNVYPFTYTGKDREPSNYHVDLVNLVLPNITLNCGYVGRIAYYPYVYVQLANVSATGGGLNNLMLSNNPNASTMIFKCPINDVNHPSNTPFIKIDCNRMSQIFKFTPYDALQFQVILPNGDFYQTLEPERLSPNEPNYKIQISAVFKFEKI